MRKPKPNLVKIGDHYVDPNLVACFKQAKKGLYIMQLKNEEERQYPLWVSEKEVEAALKFFDVKGVQP